MEAMGTPNKNGKPTGSNVYNGPRLIRPGKDGAEPDKSDIRDRIKSILKEVDEQNAELMARLILEAIKRERGDRWVIVCLFVLSACALEALALLYLYK